MPEYMQHETRQNYQYTDIHGRAYNAIVDTRTKPHLAPCTPLQPRFTAPIMPQGTLLRADPQKLGTLEINYAQWIDEAVDGWTMWERRMYQEAEAMFKDDAQRAIDERDPRLLAVVGPPPMHPDFVRAAASGASAWVLGLAPVDKVPEWAKPILSTLPQYRTPVSAGRISETFADTFADEPDDEAEPELVGVGAGEESATPSTGTTTTTTTGTPRRPAAPRPGTPRRQGGAS